MEAVAAELYKPGPVGKRDQFRKWAMSQFMEHTQTAIRGLVDIAESKDNKPEVRLAAMKEILDRGLGKALNVAQMDVLSTEGAHAVLDASRIEEADTDEIRQLLQGLQKLARQERIEGQAIDITPDP
jgi:hypothetical protein